MNHWSSARNLLVVRLDNMGDLLMSSPAIHALKKTFGSRITLLTSSMAKNISHCIPGIDEVMVFDVPWVKTQKTDFSSLLTIVEDLRARNFDAAVIFTVFSQNPLPAAMMLAMAGIPLRLAYCRENPYQLLTHWIPDEEPYSYVRHQVRRDLDLVKSIGALVKDENIYITVPPQAWASTKAKLTEAGIDPEKPWLILHPGVSEKKREYPLERWIQAGRKLVSELHHQLVLTGAAREKEYVGSIREGIGKNAFSLAGVLNIEEFIALIAEAPLVISVNTSTIHIAAATHTPVVVLYAATNPQHTPWKVPGRILLFDVPPRERSKNEILQYVRQTFFPKDIPMTTPDEIVKAALALLKESATMPLIPELITFK